MKKRLMACAFALIFVQACQTAGPVDETSPLAKTADTVANLTGLGSQTLQPGDCGLFLWNRTDAQTFMFFSQAGEGVAKYYVDDAEESVSMVSAGSELFGQFHTSTRWELTDGRTFDLELEPGEELEDGQRIDSGILTLVDAEGWRTKTPVAGVRACQPDGA